MKKLIELLFVSASGIIFLSACRLAGHPPRETTLADRSIPYQVVHEPFVEVGWGESTAKLADNRAVPPDHREGYSGIIELRRKGGLSPFVPAYAGLNLEHINNGRIYADRNLQFEPRRHPMELRRIDNRTYDLYQAALPNTGVESCTRFHFAEPNAIDVTFECVPREEKFPFGYLNIFWASYIQKPEDMSVYFLGHKKGETGERWIKGVTPKHGVLSTHRGADDHRAFGRDEPFPLTLVFNESEYEFTRPFYYGRYADNVWIVMFHPEDHVRLTQSPSGGGDGNPAWDFQWFIDHPEKDRLSRLRYRAVYKAWVSNDDVIAEYERFRKGSN